MSPSVITPNSFFNPIPIPSNNPRLTLWVVHWSIIDVIMDRCWAISLIVTFACEIIAPNDSWYCLHPVISNSTGAEIGHILAMSTFRSTLKCSSDSGNIKVCFQFETAFYNLNRLMNSIPYPAINFESFAPRQEARSAIVKHMSLPQSIMGIPHQC